MGFRCTCIVSFAHLVKLGTLWDLLLKTHYDPSPFLFDF